MPITMNGQNYYRTVDICRMAGISRATLFRWLAAGTIAEPGRDRRGWRVFTEDETNRICREANKTTDT